MDNIERAVFIVGCGRSGTTMLGAMLGVNEHCITTPESQFNMDIYRMLPDFDASKALGILKSHKRFKIWELDISDKEGFLLESKTHKEFIYRVVSLYQEHFTPDKDANIWIDHTPANVSKCDMLLDIFPEAKIIHIVRDGRAVAASHKKVKWGKHYMPDMASHWFERVSLGLSAEALYPDSVMRVSYEELVLDTKYSLKRVCSFLDIDYSDDMQRGNGFILPKYTKAQHRLVGAPPNRSRVDSWREELSDREIEIFEYGAGPLLRMLGYTPLYTNPKRIKKIEELAYRVKKLAKRLRGEG